MTSSISPLLGTLIVLLLLASRVARAESVALQPAPAAPSPVGPPAPAAADHAAPVNVAAPVVAPALVAVPVGRTAGRARFARVLPTLRVAGDTKGDADFSLGLDVALGLAENWDTKLSPEANVRTSTGVAEILRSDEDAATPTSPSSFGGGLTVWFVRLPPELNAKEYYGGPGYQQYLDRRTEAFFICDQACPAGATNAMCNAFDRTKFDSAKRANPVFIDMGESELCVAGAQYLSRLRRERDGSRPRLLISAGGSGDAITTKYVGSGDGVLRSRTFGGYKAGVALAVLSGSRQGKDADHQMTIELFGGASGSPKPSKSAIEWCVPGPTVVGESVAGESTRCESSVFGAPTTSRSGSTGIYAGYLYEGKLDWRAALGGTFTGTKRGDQLMYIAGAELPIYIDFLSASKAVDNARIAYRGVAIVRPRLEVTFTPDAVDVGPHWTALMRIELRGARELFAGALTYF